MKALLAALFVVGTWWIGTGVVLILDGRPRDTYRRSLVGAGCVALLGLFGLAVTSRDASASSAVLAFASSLAVWAWHELAFLTGVVTGPRRTPCPPGARGWRRFVYGAETVLHHELALAWTLIVVFVLTRGGPNQVGAAAFLVLWTMRLSAKLNIFLGVRNLSTGFIPAHLQYLTSYFRRAPLNPLMPFSMILGTTALVRLVLKAAAATDSLRVGYTLVATLLAVALLEHFFLALPIPDAWLWRWALRPGHGAAGQGERA